MSAVGVFSIFLVPEAQASTRGFPMYTWGNNITGQLGQGSSGPSTNSHTLARVGTETNWTMVVSAGQGSYAINAEGELFAWGREWYHPQMGQGGIMPPLSNLHDLHVSIPTRVGSADDWVYIAARSTVVAAINEAHELYTWGNNWTGQLGHDDFGAATYRNIPTRVEYPARDWASVAVGGLHGNFMLAITTDGDLYSWGRNYYGALGHGTIGTTGNYVLRPQRVQALSNVRSVSTGNTSVKAITHANTLYSWGSNAFGQLGRGDVGGADRSTPMQVGTNSNWTDVRTTIPSIAAINSAGHLYTWGSAQHGQLGDGLARADSGIPTRIAPQHNWVSIHGGNSHFLAFNSNGELWAWGNNTQGQLGIGNFDNNDGNVPTLVIQTYGFSGAARGAGTQSIMLLRLEFEEKEFPLTKHLQKPYGTPVPNLTFTFEFEPSSFETAAGLGDIAHVPNIPNRTITIDNTSDSDTAGGIVTLSDYTDALTGISFDRVGTFSWIVTETQSATGVGPNSEVIFSQAEYEMRVYVGIRAGIGGNLYIRAITLTPIVIDNPSQTAGEKTDYFVFTNQYMRTTAATEHFEISKNITGPFADLSDTFTFAITLTRTALCPNNRTFIGRVVDMAGNSVSPPRTYTFNTGASQNVVLGHDQRLIFDGANAIILGSTFLVVEQACPFHIASARVYSYDTHLPPNPPNYVVLTNTQANQDRTTNTHMIGANRNAAEFTNEHQYQPPTGLFLISGSPYLILLAAGFLVTAHLSLKARKRIEELPVMH